MTETLFQKLEDKVILLLNELEKLRGEVTKLKFENASLKTEKVESTQKLQALIDTFDKSHSLTGSEWDLLQDIKQEI